MIALPSTRAMIQRATTDDVRATPTAVGVMALTSAALTTLPRQSPGVLAAALDDRVVLYDLVTEVVHVLNTSAALVWLSCDGSTDLAGAVDPIVEATGALRSEVEADIESGVEQLRGVGLVGRTDVPPVPAPVERAPLRAGAAGPVYAVLDDGVRFHGDDASLLDEIAAVLGPADDGRAPTIDLEVRLVDDGMVCLDGWGEPRTYGSRAAFLDGLPSALNQIAATSATCIALHAGAVRSPAGTVVLLPALSGAGKTTLTASLVRAGWDYATDEAVGVRAGSLGAVAYPKPLVLDLASQGVLGLGPTGTLNVLPAMLRSDVTVLQGDIGRVGRVVLPRYEEGAEVTLTQLEPSDAVIGILEHALNLARVGRPGLETLCQLALEVPVHRLVHGGAIDAVPAIEALAG
jgi:hypothetical protein